MPVPVTHALCRDEAVLGAPFYVMERVAGKPYRFKGDLAALGAERTRTISYPDQELHLVMDNYAAHKRVEVREWLAANPRVQVHFTRPRPHG